MFSFKVLGLDKERRHGLGAFIGRFRRIVICLGLKGFISQGCLVRLLRSSGSGL